MDSPTEGPDKRGESLTKAPACCRARGRALAVRLARAARRRFKWRKCAGLQGAALSPLCPSGVSGIARMHRIPDNRGLYPARQGWPDALESGGRRHSVSLLAWPCHIFICRGHWALSVL